jgi:putative zinc finger/helix-turn-helix YgiT family protein
MTDMAETCVECGQAALAVRVVPFTVVHGNKEALIQDEQTVCGHCGTVSYVGEQASRHELAVAAKIREMDGLLSAEDLRRIRLKYGFRQTDMEAMLSVGPKTWTRWERGKVPQSKAADTLIRVLAADPEVARRLMEWAGIDNPEALAIFARIDADMSRLAEANLRARIGGSNDEQKVRHMAMQAIDALRDAQNEMKGEAA